MTTYTITLTEAQDKALAYAALSPQDWIENAVFEYCRLTMDKIVHEEIDRRLSVGESISGTKDEIVLAADIESAANRQARSTI